MNPVSFPSPNCAVSYLLRDFPRVLAYCFDGDGFIESIGELFIFLGNSVTKRRLEGLSGTP